MKSILFKLSIASLLAAQAMSAHALTYSITAGSFSSESGATTVDFGVSPINNSAATTGALPAGYTGGSLFNPSTAGISSLAARPAGGSDNFWSFGTGESGTVDLGTPLSYYGFLWGSPDSYNTVSFYDGTTLLGSYTGAVLGLSSAWVNSAYFNVYAGAGEQITSVVFSSSGMAFESDNHAYIMAIPEPSTYGMMLSGVALLGFVARRRLTA